MEISLAQQIKDTIDCATENAYYLNEADIKQMIEFAWQHSEHYIDRYKFIEVVNEITQDMFSWKEIIMAYGYSYYVVVFTSVDWFTLYEGSTQVTARNDKEAEKLARKKLKIDPIYTSIVVEDIYGPYKINQ